MSRPLDVSVLACGWRSHEHHARTVQWLETQRTYYTCPFSQLGFLRVSLSPAFRAEFDDAQLVLQHLVGRRGARFLPDGIGVGDLPRVRRAQDVTDAYFVDLARSRRLTLATLDDALCRMPWATGIAFNPIVP